MDEWYLLKNRLDDFAADDNALVIIDGSASMYAYGTLSPASIAISLGIYFAEHSKGAFAGHFMTFSESPQIVKVQGVILISGCTPRIFSMTASGAADPYEFMMKNVSSQRYACITA